MRRVWSLLYGLLFSGLLTLTFPPYARAENTHAIWHELLALYVHDGQVDYLGFKQDEALLDSYLARLNEARPDELARSDRLAFYLNAYNAYTVKLILDHFNDGRPVESIKDIGGFFTSPWSIRFAGVGGEQLTLDEIEHNIIRLEFGEPRVHFAVNCASKSCPPLISEAYVGDRLEAQLEKNTIAFLNNPVYNRIDGKTLSVTRIFNWFSKDFQDDIPGFVRKYAKGKMLQELEIAGDELRVKYLDYDWSLNSH